MHVNACEHMQKHTQTHDNAHKHTQKLTRTQTHLKMLINYVKFHTNSRKYIYTHTKIQKRTFKSTQTHVKTKTTYAKNMTQIYVNNYIGSGYIYNQWIYWVVIHTNRIIYGMNSGAICYAKFTYFWK